MNDMNKALETLKINLKQAEMLANKTESKDDKYYFAGYILGIKQAIDVLEQGRGPATVVIKERDITQVKGIDL
jgi:hypothetical protein